MFGKQKIYINFVAELNYGNKNLSNSEGVF